MLVWLSVWSEVQTCIQPSWCHCHSLSLASVKHPDWFYLSGTSSHPGTNRLLQTIYWILASSKGWIKQTYRKIMIHKIHKMGSPRKRAIKWPLNGCACVCSSSGGLCGYQLQRKQNACAHHREHGGHGYSGNAEELLRHHSSFTDSTATWQHKRTEPGIIHTPAARLTNYLTTHTHTFNGQDYPGQPVPER